jgi:hypothetical protein
MPFQLLARVESCNNVKNQTVTLAGFGKPYPAGDFAARKK